MASGSRGTAYKLIQSLFEEGCGAGLTDGQLLERFAAGHSEAAERAFATLVDRHGADVLRTCRSILRDEHAAEDAFQAVFLVLVRKSRSLWVADSLGPWLHRVACRAAGRAKKQADSRRIHEIQLFETRAGSDANEDRLGHAAAIHEEVDRLPERFRTPIVLCDLHGCTYEEAARQLGCSIATVKGRLARGRERLRRRLVRRGFVPSYLLLPMGLWARATGTIIPRSLAHSTIKAAACVAANRSVATGVISTQVAAITKGVLIAMALPTVKMGAVFVSLTIVAIAVSAVVAAQQGNDRPEVRMGPDRRAANCNLCLPLVAPRRSGKIPSGLSFDQVRPAIVAALKEHGSAKVTTLAGIEVSVRLYSERELDSAEALLKQVLTEGPVDIRGPADPITREKTGSAGWSETTFVKQQAPEILSSARR